MKDGYVSEFTLFINQYLADHPEVVEDQKRGWDIFWNKKVDFGALEEAQQDAVPDDGYGSYLTDSNSNTASARRHHP